MVHRTISRGRASEGAVSTRVTFSPHDIFHPSTRGDSAPADLARVDYG